MSTNNYNFWNLCKKGFPVSKIEMLYSFKYTIFACLVTICSGYISNAIFNNIIINQIEDHNINIKFMILVLICQSLPHLKILLEWILRHKLFQERNDHSIRIIKHVKKMFKLSSYKWREEYTEFEQKESYKLISDCYDFIIWRVLIEFTNIMLSIYTTFQLAIINKIIIFAVIVYYLIMMKFLIPFMNKLTEENNKTLATRSKELRINYDNQFAFYFDRQTNKLYENINQKLIGNFIDASIKLTKTYEITNDLVSLEILIRQIASILLLFSICIYGYFTNDYKIILLVMVNSYGLTSGINGYNELKRIYDIQGGRLLNVFIMLNKLNIICLEKICIDKNKISIINKIMLDGILLSYLKFIFLYKIIIKSFII